MFNNSLLKIKANQNKNQDFYKLLGKDSNWTKIMQLTINKKLERNPVIDYIESNKALY